MVAGSLGTIAPMTYLNAATVSNAASIKNVSSQSVKIKDTTITFKDITAAPKGSIGFLLNATLEKESGIPEGTSQIMVLGTGKVEINGKNYELSFGGGNNFKKLSNTKAEIQISITPQVGTGANTKVAKEVTAQNIKGQKVTFKLNSIYYKYKNTTPSTQFTEALKKVSNVQGVSLKQAGFEDYLAAQIKGKVLPEGGLNIPIADGSKSVIDNMGFVDGKFQIRTKDAIEMNGEAMEISEINLVDSTGKGKRTNSGGVNELGIYIFDIKDLNTLSKCTPKLYVSKTIAEDIETNAETVTCVF